MSKKLKFIVVSVWIILSRSYDVYATYQYTPDLSKEANPLTSVLGLGWLPLIIIVCVLTTYIIYAYYISLFEKYKLYPAKKHYSFSRFIGYMQTGKNIKWTGLFYTSPSDIKRVHHNFGPILAMCLSYAGIISTIMWLMINYTSFYKTYHNTGFIYGLIGMGCIALSIKWYWRHYLMYRETSASMEI